jgi:LPXTG-site transpeptidase (sortase) family protein
MSLRHQRRQEKWVHRALITAGVSLVAAAIGWQVNATLWTTHARQAGSALVRQYRHSLHGSSSGAAQVRLGRCGAAAKGGVQGLLVIPALGITAPVEEGVDDAQLNVAVGHLPTSVEPGTSGTSVLEAHNVSYFVDLPNLSNGAVVRYETPCRTDTFIVQGHTVVNEGAPVYNTAGPSLTLITCWPTNALWFTPQRFVVSTAEVASKATTGAVLTYEVGPPPPAVPAPAVLVSEGLSLTTNSIPMGTLTLAGSPGGAWTQSTGPLLVEDSAVAAFIAGIKSLTQVQLAWWADVAPGVPAPPPLVGASVPRYQSPLEVTVTAAGSTATAVTLSTTVAVSGGHDAGRYTVTVGETVSSSKLVVSSWTMRPS